ncbi:MAG: DedA family protein [Leptospiraceae bacterium]|nr:DedA family protein [Leptospiraceae bacterium]
MILEAGSYVTLFAAAFLAATILPFSSELAFSGAILGGLDPWKCLVVASAGNCLACSVNYAGGYILGRPFLIRMLRRRRGRRIYRFVHKSEILALLFSWTPIAGDPITLAAGALRTNPWIFHSLVWPLRIGRYLAILYAMSSGDWLN